MRKQFFKKWHKITFLTILLTIIAIAIILYLSSGIDFPYSKKQADIVIGKSIERALQTAIDETGISDITQFCDSSGKKLLPYTPTYEDVIKVLQTPIVLQNKTYGPYLDPNDLYNVNWDAQYGGQSLGFYIRILKDTKKAYVTVVSIKTPSLANRVDIIDSNHLFAKTPIPTLLYEK